MSLLKRLEIALPLIGLTLFLLVAAVGGTWKTWDTSITYERVAFVAVCVVLATGLGVGLSILLRPCDYFPWARVLLAVASIVLSGVLLWMSDAVAQSFVSR